MSQITNQQGRAVGAQGFTLIELLVAMVIFSALSLVSVQILWNTVTTRSKQYSIENSAAAIRPIEATLTQSILSASGVNVASVTQIQITGSVCRTIQWNATNKSLEEATDTSASCVPPTTGFTPLTVTPVSITVFTISPTGTSPKVVTFSITGLYKDSLGSHAFQYNFSVAPRVAL